MGETTTLPVQPKNQNIVIPTRKSKTRNTLMAYLFLAPAFIIITLFVFVPLFFSLIISLFNNPTAVDLRFAMDYYSNFGENLSLASLRKFFSADADLVKGVFVINGLFNLFVIIILIMFVRILFKSLLKRIEAKIGDPQDYKAKKLYVRPFVSAFVILLGSILAPLIIWGLKIFFDKATFISVPIQLPIEQYRVVLTDIELDFIRILFNTFFWTLTCTLFHVILGMFLAVLLNRNFLGKGFFRGVFILPWAIPSFVSTLVWRAFIFDKDQGFLGKRTSTLVGSSFSFSIGDSLGLLIIIVIVFGLIAFLIHLFSKYLHIHPGFRSLIYFILGIAGIVLVVVLQGLLSNALTLIPGNLFNYQVIDIPAISRTFWYTDDVFIFGFRFKMITFSAILVNIWLGVPFMMVSFLAALQSIPQDLYEAAEIDGSSAWDRFKKITFPLLKPTLFTVSLLGIIWTFNLFNVVYLLGQNQTGIGSAVYYDIFVTFIYRQFSLQQYSRAAALSFIVFIILLVFSQSYKKLIRYETMFEGKEPRRSNKEVSLND